MSILEFWFFLKKSRTKTHSLNFCTGKAKGAQTPRFWIIGSGALIFLKPMKLQGVSTFFIASSPMT